MLLHVCGMFDVVQSSRRFFIVRNKCVTMAISVYVFMMTESGVEEEKLKTTPKERGGRGRDVFTTHATPSDTPTDDRQQTERLPEEQRGDRKDGC